MKPVCVKCERFYRPKKNGTPFLEMKPKGFSVIGRRALPGTEDRDAWLPYKLWHADLWRCEGCGHEIIVGAGYKPLAEDYQKDFAATCHAYRVTITVNDC